MPEPAPASGPARLLRPLVRLGSVLGLKGVNIAASIAVTLLLARAGGPEVLGRYAIGFQTAQLLSIVAVMGCDQIVLREVAAHLRLGEGGAARAHVARAARFVASWSMALAGLWLGAALIGRASGLWPADEAMLVASLLLPANAIYLLGLGTLRGSGKPVQAQAFDGLFNLPLLAVLGLFWLGGQKVAASTALLAACASLSAVMGLMFWQLRRQIRGWGSATAIPAHAPWADGSAIMVMSFLIFLAQWLPQALAGLLGSAADAGAFRAAWQLASPLAIIYTTMGATVLAPVSGDLRQGRHADARRRLANARLAMLAAALPLALPLLIWPQLFIATLFGPEFAGTEPLLRALVLANLLPILAGPIGAAVTMTRRTGEMLPAMLLGTALMLGLALLLVPRIGPVGLALGYGAALACRFGRAWWLGRRILAQDAGLPPADDA